MTLEPIELIDTFLYEEMFDSNKTETATISSHELESIAPTLSRLPDVGCRVLEALTSREPTPPSLNRAVDGLALARNPVLDKLWDRWTTLSVINETWGRSLS